MTALDDCIGRVIEELSRLGLDEDTIVIFTSDHGGMLYSQNFFGKTKPWNESVNIPLIARWKGKIPQGQVCEELISQIDLMPTILSMCGVELKEAVDGLDLSEVFFGRSNKGPKSAFINYYVVPLTFKYKEWRGVVTNQYTYAKFKDRKWILYDNIHDKFQLNNLIDNSEYRDVVNKLDDMTGEWLEKLGDTFETSKEIADRLYPEHKDAIIPYYENDIIKNGKEKKRRI